MSRPALRLVASARLGLNVATRSPRTAFARRMMSSESHASHKSSSDTPWMIGSALVFGPLLLYLVSPSARKSHAHADHSHKSHPDEHQEKHNVQHVESHPEEVAVPIADDEGTVVSSQEIKESMEQALASDSPKDAQAHEEEVVKVEESAAIETHSEPVATIDAVPASETSSESNITSGAVDQATVQETAQSIAASESAAESSGVASN